MWIKIPTPICIRGRSVHWFKLQNLHQEEKASDEPGGGGSAHIHPLLPPHTKPPLLLVHLLSSTPPPGPSSILHPEQSKSISLVLCWPCCPSLACLKAFMWLFLLTGWRSPTMSIPWHPPRPLPHWFLPICQMSALKEPPLTAVPISTPSIFLWHHLVYSCLNIYCIL